jgi:hypothetical protein
MRYAFGLVSLLVTTAIIVWLFAKYEIPVAQRGKQAQDEVQPITGKTAEGIPAKDSIKVDGQTVNGELRSLLVTSVTPNGYFDQYYGLKVGDKVLQINGVDIGTMSVNDTGMAEANLWQVESRPITILRGTQTLTLNATDGTLGTPGGASATPASPGTPAPPAPAAPAPGGPSIPGLPSGIQVPNQ